jgi:outer membrane protein assembly factor BamB
MMSRENVTRTIQLIIISVLVIFSFGAAGEICGAFFETSTAAFGSTFPDNKVEDIKAVLGQTAKTSMTDGRPANSKGTPIALFVIEEDPRAIVGWDLKANRQLWKISPPVNSELTIGGDYAIFQSGTDVVSISLVDGRKLWDFEIEEGWDYHGAAVNRDYAAVSVGVGGTEAGGYANGRLLALNASSGSVLWNYSSGGGLLGTPALSGEMVFAPWGRQKIAVLNIDEGEEVCRILATDYTVSYVRSGTSGIYYGSLPTDNSLATLFRFNEEAATGKREGSTVFVPQLEPVPSDPGFERDGFANAVAGRSAASKIRFHWKPAASAPNTIAMVNNQFYLHYWRYIIAFDSATSKAVWTYRSEADIESIQVIGGGIIGTDSNGRLFFVDPVSGSETWAQDTQLKVLSAVFDADGFRPGGASNAPTDPVIGLKEMIRDKDNRMLPIRSYAAFLLAAMPAPEITRDLLQIYSDSSTPKGLRDAVVQALGKRTQGAEFLVDALHMRYDFLEQTQPPPMGVVATALVNMNERAAVPGLLVHLMDHETPVEYLRSIVLAIRDLGDPTVASTLRQFLRLYHADSSFLEHEDALAGAAEALLKFEDKNTAGPFIVEIRDGSQTLPELKKMLRALIDPEQAAREAAAARAATEAASKAAEEAETAAAAAAVAATRIPDSLSRDQINRTVVANQAYLRPCIQAALGLVPTLQNIRLRFMITGSTGLASEVRVLPNNVPGLRECLNEALGSFAFPNFRNMRQMATYTIRISGGRTQPGFRPSTQPGQSGQPADLDSFVGTGAPAPTPGVQPQQPQQPQQPVDPDAF